MTGSNTQTGSWEMHTSPISSPEAAILQVCARDRDLWAILRSRHKVSESDWLLKNLFVLPHNELIRVILCPLCTETVIRYWVVLVPLTKFVSDCE